jgi:glycine dehydrogenase subunit 1
VTRYLGITEADREYMLKEIGAGSVRDLFSDVPEEVYLGRKLKLEPALSEMELIKKMKSMAEKKC